jgi:hypothetical protein
MSEFRVTGSIGGMFEQSSSTASKYAYDARNAIDNVFGEGYAAKNPELVAAFMRTAAYDFRTTVVMAQFGEFIDRLGEELGTFQDILRGIED